MAQENERKALLGDEWGTESGLVETFDADVAKAWFGPNEQSQSEDPAVRNKTFLWLHCINITTEDDAALDEYTVRVSIGNDWEPIEGGAKVVRADGNTRRKFNQNTGLGRLLDRVLGEGEEGNKYGAGFEEFYRLLANSGGPRDSQIWVGHRFHFDTYTESGKDKETGKEFTYNYQIPESYLGPARFTGDNTAAPATTESNGDGDGTDKITLLQQIARTSDSHADFLTKAMQQVPDLHTDTALITKISDETDSGLYAQARA